MSRWRRAVVRATAPETPGTRSVELMVEDWPGHRPGQHVDVRLTAPDGYQAQRSYSIASAPEAPTLALTVERMVDGEVSPYLVDVVEEGDELEVRGPVGGPFTWTVEDGGPLLLLAGGSGLVALMAMLRHRAARGSSVEARLVVSARTPADALHRPELDRLAASPGLLVRWAFTRSAGGRDGDLHGRLGPGMLEALTQPPTMEPRVFVCGPTGFVEQVATTLVELGHDPGDIRTERFGPT